MTWLFRALAIVGLLVTTTSAVQAAKGSSASVGNSLAQIVNRHALPAHMITGKRGHGNCVLALDSKFLRATDFDTAKAQDRVFKELKQSGMIREIQRYNSPRRLADERVFRVDESTCAPLEYRPHLAEFKPPDVRTRNELVIQYASNNGRTPFMELELVTGGKTHRLSVVRQDPSGIAPVLDLSAPPEGPIFANGQDLVLKWRGEIFADWPLDRWPLLRNVRLHDRNARIRISQGRDSGDANSTSGALTGSRLAFPEGSVLTFLQVGKDGMPVPKAQLSWRQAKASEVLYESRLGGRVSWARNPTNFEAQIVRALSELPATGKKVVTLALRPELNKNLQDALNGAAADHTQVEKKWHVYGSVVVMDGLTGEYLGVAGYPEAPAPRILPQEGFVANEIFREEFLSLRNIGSVAKAPISYSIISTSPILAGLTMKPYDPGSQRSVLGLNLQHSLNEIGNPHGCDGGVVDFNCFLKKSLNRYAATLVTLAAIPALDKSDPIERLTKGTQPLGNDSVALTHGGRNIQIDRQPSELIWRGGKDPTGEQLLGLAWVQYARREFDIDVAFSQDTGITKSDVHGYVWRFATPQSNPRLSGVDMISPEKENLRLDQARDYRANYLPLILGGGESAWSSAKVAETFARTVSGLKIQGSFVKVPSHQVWPQIGNSTDPQVQGARSKYLNGLANVFVSGTGAKLFGSDIKALKSRADRLGMKLAVYAKSGTPTIEDPERVDHDGLIQHPIEMAFRDKVLSSTVAGTNKITVSHLGNVIDSDLLARRVAPSGNVGHKELTLSHLRFLARFNQLDRQAQSELCRLEGSTLVWRQLPFAQGNRVKSTRSAHGRNYAIYAELRRPHDDQVCRAISIAVSFSEEKGKAFTRLLQDLLDPSNGALARSLGLASDQNGVTCAGENS